MKLNIAVQEFNLSLCGEVKESSRRWYLYQLVKLPAFLGEETELSSITAGDLRRWRASLLESGRLKIRTVNDHVAAVRRFFSFCHKEGFISADPSASLRRIQDEDEDTEPRAISVDDFLLLLNEAAARGKVRDVAIILFLFGTGCRVSGLCGLELKDVDLSAGRAWVVEKGRGAGKGRWVYLDGPVILALDKYIYECRPTDQGPKLFQGERCQGLTRQGVWYILQRHAEAAGVEGNFNPHAFRHAFAIQMLIRGLSLSAVSQLLGHASISITHQHYAKFEQSQLQELHRQYSPVAILMLPVNST